MRVLVTGANGQLGRAIVAEFGRDRDVIALSRQHLDVTDHAAVVAAIGGARPSVVINCAAYNDVDGAEDQAVTALELNAFAVRSLARAAASAGATFMYYGTDFVFDGNASAPYTEDDRPNPRGTYAASKLLGEWFARDVGHHYVLRVESLFGGERAKGTLDKIVDAILEGREMKVFVDRTVSPTYVEDVARVTRALVERGAPHGLYHCVNTGLATWFELAREAARQLGREGRFVPVAMADVALRAPRPRFCALSNARLASIGIAMPTWQDALSRYLAARQAQAFRHNV